MSHSPAAAAVQSLTLRAPGRQVALLAGPGAMENLPGALERAGFRGRPWVVADETALRLHGSTLRAVLPEARVLQISGAEADKTLAQAARVWDWLLEQGAQRRDALVAFGGGVVCDLVGFAASAYLRGIALVNVPTTLLAQVDASVGGKTGVNHPRGKNLIGAFHQPAVVVADTRFLATLPARAFAGGMAEIAKIGMAMDAALFTTVESQAAWLTPDAATLLGPIVARAIELKAGVVERDEREAGERMLLNYGHTLGHALEAAAGYGQLLHGEAVAVGMIGAATISEAMGLLDWESAARQQALIEALGLPTRAPGVPSSEVLIRLQLDKKRDGERQRWVLADRVGHAQIRDDVPLNLVEHVAHRLTSAID